MNSILLVCGMSCPAARVVDMFSGNDFKGAMIMMAIICGLIGWGSIELVLWIVSHITLGLA